MTPCACNQACSFVTSMKKNNWYRYQYFHQLNILQCFLGDENKEYSCSEPSPAWMWESRVYFQKAKSIQKKWILYYMKSFCVTFEQLVQVHINEKCAAIAIFEPVFSIQGHNMLGNGELRFLPNQFPEFFKSKSLIHCRKRLNHQKPKAVLGGNPMKIVIQESACNENQVRPLLFKS